jgi:hypothetical protein
MEIHLQADSPHRIPVLAIANGAADLSAFGDLKVDAAAGQAVGHDDGRRGLVIACEMNVDAVETLACEGVVFASSANAVASRVDVVELEAAVDFRECDGQRECTRRVGHALREDVGGFDGRSGCLVAHGSGDRWNDSARNVVPGQQEDRRECGCRSASAEFFPMHVNPQLILQKNCATRRRRMFRV